MVRAEVRVSGNSLKNVFGRMSIQASVLDPLVPRWETALKGY